MAGEARTNPTSLPPTPAGWREMQIEELCERVTSGGTPSRQRTEFYEDGVFSWFKTKELKDCALYDSEERITQDALDSSSAKLFPPNTVLMAMYGDGITITSLGILRRQAATNQACCAMIPKSTVCEPRFLFYSLLNHREDFIRIASGGAQRNLSGSLIRWFALNAPPLAEQKSIAAVLGTLDDKIELNRRMNATLEAMARALFKDWFVDFGPVRAKMEGREPYLPEEIWRLFPERLDKEGKPEGWETQPLGAQFVIIGGGTPKTSVTEYWNGDIPWFSVVDTPSTGDVFVIATEKSITKNGLAGSSARLIPKGTTIISARGTVGNLAVTGREMTFNQSCYALRGAQGVGDYFVYLTAQQMVDQLKSMAHGSVFSTITRQTFEAIQRPKPSAAILRAFERSVAAWFESILSNVEESHTLAQLRDTLLPKLISGELRVPEVKAQVEEAIA